MTDADLQDAEDAGVIFYARPDEVDDWSGLDPLMQPVCEKINQSGWVWTAESCQGHPEATNPAMDWGNRTPFIRLVCQRRHRGLLLDALVSACEDWYDYLDPDDEEGWGASAHRVLAFEVLPKTDRGAWFEAIVYIGRPGTADATCTYQRDMGMAGWRAFAHKVNEPPKGAHHA